MEFEVEYVDGTLDRHLAYIEDEPDYESVDEGMAKLLTGESLDEIELSEDYTSAVVPLDCAALPTDAENTVRVAFSRITRTGTPAFARAEVSVMKGGELYVHEPEVEDWELDSNGNWIQQ